MNLMIINERGPNFWGDHLIEDKSTYAALTKNKQTTFISDKEFQDKLALLQGKKVLVLIHGLKTSQKDFLATVTQFAQNISQVEIKPNSFWSKSIKWIKEFLGYSQKIPTYDAIIGYSWPSYSHEFHYFDAQKNAKEIAPRLSKNLEELTQLADKVDIIAHSMGNFLLFESLLKQKTTPFKLNHIYSLAAAVPHNSLEMSQRYQKIMEKCNHLFILHSKHDEALGWPYYLVEGQQALGLHGPETSSPPLMNLTSVNCSSIIKDHSGYLDSNLLYMFLGDQYHQEKPLNPLDQNKALNSSAYLQTYALNS